jgi:tRNA pseudouridine55 synthase
MARRRDDRGPDGVAVVDKEAAWTSHDVVAKARGILQTRKVGHAGTLDPDATGVLVLGVGQATRLLRYCTELPKQYVGEIVFGIATSTLDAAGEVTAEVDMRHLTPSAVQHAAAAFVGDIEQVPPMVSAVKVGGRRLHELAREGKEVERAPRPVTVYRYDLEPLDPTADGNPVYRCHVECSSGTYVRTLAADLGEALGGVAHLRALRRTAVGPFTLDGARPLEALDRARLLPLSAAVAHLDAARVDAPTAALVANGRILDAEALRATSTGPYAVFDEDDRLLAIYEHHPKSGGFKPALVLAAARPAESGGQAPDQQ